MKERPQLGRREIVGVKFTSQKNVCPIRGKSDSWKKCLLENMPPRKYNSWNECLLNIL